MANRLGIPRNRQHEGPTKHRGRHLRPMGSHPHQRRRQRRAGIPGRRQKQSHHRNRQRAARSRKTTSTRGRTSLKKTMKKTGQPELHDLLVSLGQCRCDSLNRLALAAERAGTAGFTPTCPDSASVWCRAKPTIRRGTGGWAVGSRATARTRCGRSSRGRNGTTRQPWISSRRDTTVGRRGGSFELAISWQAQCAGYRRR